MNIPLLTAHISSLSVLIPLTLAIIQWKKLPEKIAAFRWLLVACAVTELGSFLSSQVFSIHNQFVGSAYMFIQFTLLLYIFSLQFERKAVLKIAYVALVVIYLISLLLLKSFSESTDSFEALASLILIIVPIVFFYKLLNELRIINIHKLPILWISFATLFYYSGNLFAFLARSYLESVPDSYKIVWMLHNILNTTKNVLFAIALWQNYRTMKS